MPLKWIKTIPAKLREPFASGSHLLGAITGVFGSAYLVMRCDGSCDAVSAVLVYSLALIAVFLVSGLFHGLHCSDAMLSKLERLDYAAIYIFIAASYTPVCLLVIKGNFGGGLLLAEWLLAILGVWLALTRGPSGRNLQVAIFLAMGWAFLFALPSLSSKLSPMAMNFLILGGVFYSVGAVVFAFDWPKLFRDKLSAHDIWHVLVLLGSASHYVFVVQIISRVA